MGQLNRFYFLLGRRWGKVALTTEFLKNHKIDTKLTWEVFIRNSYRQASEIVHKLKKGL